jgi:magnesium chelatase accessory protein
VLLLAHGTGASTHSWRGMIAPLAAHFTVVAPDLTGHGFTSVPAWHRLTLPGMARELAALMTTLGLPPALTAGHSAGAAIIARACIDGLMAPRGLVSFNGAFVPFGGAASAALAPLGRLMVALPLVPDLFVWRARDPKMVNRLLTGTGSRLDAEGTALYTKLVRVPGHAAAALRMMANWELAPLLADLPALPPKLLLVAAQQDRAIPPADAARVASLVPGAELLSVPALGHLSHEEDPAGATAIILAFARRLGVL